MVYFRKALLAALAAVVFGCAGGAAVPERPPGGLYIESVPFFPQDEYMCGPAALASVMGHYGARSGMDEVAREVYSERLRGTLPVDLLIYAREKGFDAKYFKGSMADIRESVGRGEPLVLFLNLGYGFYPVGHYIVVVGVDEASSTVFAHSGTEKEKAYTFRELDRAWSKTGYSTLLVRPKAGQE